MDMPTETCSDETNLLDYVRIILKHRLLVFCVVGITVVVTAIVSLLTKPTYEAKALISPPGKSTDVSGMGMAALAVQFGISSPASANMSELVNLLKSNILKEKTIKRYDLMPILFEKVPFNNKTEEQKMWAGIGSLSGKLKVTTNLKENSIQLSMKFKDPKMAASILSYMLAELTDYMSDEARRVSETNKKYLEQEVEKTADPFIRTKIYSLIAQQVESSMMAQVKENFAFKVLDPPRAPDQRIAPKRTQMVMVAFAVSLLGGILAAFGKEYWSNHKGEIKRLIREVK
jgi:uncharacterized protein involved in exopolysaccharide biosynthesis